MTIITSAPILDSAGKPVNGALIGYQTRRFDTPAGLVTEVAFRAQVTNGVITRNGGPLDIPATPSGQALFLVELFESTDEAGRPIITPSEPRAVQVPAVTSIAYADLVPVTLDPVDAWGPSGAISYGTTVPTSTTPGTLYLRKVL